MDIKTHIRFWIFLFAVSLFLSPFIRRGDSMESFARNEIRMTEAAFGATFGGWIRGSVDTLFANSPAAAVSKTASLGVTSDKKKEQLQRHLGKGIRGMADMANGYFTGVMLAAYVACMRLLVVVVWFGMLAPVLVAAVMDGFAQRAIGQYRFGAIRPAAHSILAMIVVPFALAPLLYLTIPIPISPTIIPVWVFIGCLPLSLLIANTQPVFGRH